MRAGAAVSAHIPGRPRPPPAHAHTPPAPHPRPRGACPFRTPTVEFWRPDSRALGGAPGVLDELREHLRASGRSLNRLARETGVGSDRLSRFMTGKRGLSAPA